MSLPSSLHTLFITLVNSFWSDEIGGPVLSPMGGFPRFRFTLLGCHIYPIVHPVSPINSFPVSVVSD